VRAVRETVNELKNLVSDVDDLIGAIGNTKIASFVRGIGVGRVKEYAGEVVDYGNEVVVNQEVPFDSKVKVRYKDGRIIIEFDGNVKSYEIGNVDKSSITAERRFTTLTVRAKKVKEEDESEEEEEEEESGGDGSEGDN